MKTNYSILSLIFIAGLGLSIAHATMPSNSPSGSSQKEGIFYTYFENMAKTSVLPNPFLSGFTTDYSISHGDGNNLIKSFLATLGGTSTDIITGFDSSGNITKTTISAVTKEYLGANAGAGSAGEGIVGFYPTGMPVYSREIGYWNKVGSTLTYNGGVQIGSIIPTSLTVVGNITVLNAPSANDDLITKGYADAYMKDICTRFLGSWNDATATCSAGSIPGPSCVAHACTATNPACGTTTTGTSDSCGTVCTKTGPACASPNSCAATLPACNGVGCTTTTGTPSSVGQAWTKGAANCGFSCTGGYTGANCEIPGVPKCYDVQITYDGNPAGPDYVGPAGSYLGSQRCFSNNYATQKSLTTCPSGVPNAPLASGGFTNNKCVYSFMGKDWWGHFACVETSCSPASPSCAATLPACNGVSCTTTTGTPSSVGQAWTKGAASCGFSCTGGYTGANCEIAPAVGNCMSYIESWSNVGQSGNCSATIPAGYTVGDNQSWVSSPTVTLTNATPGYTGSVTFKCIDSDPPVGTTAAEWVYVSGTCNPIVVAPNCSDGVKNGSETGIDCGGPSCAACSASPFVFQIASFGPTGGSCGFYHGNNYPTAGQSCNRIYPGHLCAGGDGNIWKCELPVTLPNCSDGIQNGGETGVDCGGSCSACAPTCTPGVAHQILTGGSCVDCDSVGWSNTSFASNVTATQRACYLAFHDSTDCTASDGHIIPNGSFFLDGTMQVCDNGTGIPDVTDCGAIIDTVHYFNVPDHASPTHKRYWCDRG